MIVVFFFFFQAEDGIRDYKVTGVQTCALPIWGQVSEQLPRINHFALTTNRVALSSWRRERTDSISSRHPCRRLKLECRESPCKSTESHRGRLDFYEQPYLTGAPLIIGFVGIRLLVTAIRKFVFICDGFVPIDVACPKTGQSLALLSRGILPGRLAACRPGERQAESTAESTKGKQQGENSDENNSERKVHDVEAQLLPRRRTIYGAGSGRIIGTSSLLCGFRADNGFNGQYRGHGDRLYGGGCARRKGYDHGFHWTNDSDQHRWGGFVLFRSPGPGSL